MGMAAGCEGLIYAHRNQGQQGADQEKGGQDEGSAGILYSAKVHDRQDGQNQQAQSQGVGLKFGQCGGHRRYAGGDAYGRGQDVVDHQRRGGGEPRFFTQILAGDGVAAAAARVSSDGLAIAEIDDHQQDQNGGDYGQKVLGAYDP